MAKHNTKKNRGKNNVNIECAFLGLDDTVMKCPGCHRPIVIVKGYFDYHICYRCGYKITDKKLNSTSNELKGVN